MILPCRASIALVLGFFVATGANAQSAGLDFLRLGPDAEAMSLGDARVASSQDAYAVYWNPAGLAGASRNSAAVSHHIWVADVRTYAAATRLGFGRHGALGFGIVATGTSDLEARDQPGEPSGFFGVQFLSIAASYGRAIGPLRVGLTGKYLSEEIFDATANGYAFDLGAQADLLEGALELGVSLQNLGEMSELEVRATQLPRLIRVGAAIHPLRILSSDDDAALLNAFALFEVSHVFPDEMTRLHFGVGAEVMELVRVRAGYVSNDELRSITFGLGLIYEPFQVDYAFVPFESGFNGPGHVISLTYRW